MKFPKFLVSEWVPQKYMVFLAAGPDIYITPLLRQYYAFITPTRTFQKNLAGVISFRRGVYEVIQIYFVYILYTRVYIF